MTVCVSVNMSMSVITNISSNLNASSSLGLISYMNVSTMVTFMVNPSESR